MASLTSHADGSKTLQFIDGENKRRSIRLGKIKHSHARRIQLHVEQLVSARNSGMPPDDATAEWVTTLSPVMLQKLVAFGLVPKPRSQSLGPFVDEYIAGRSDVKPGTLIAYRQVRGNLVDYFGADKPLRAITAGDAENWRIWLSKQVNAKATLNRRCKTARQFFTSAIDHELIRKNPFAKLDCGTRRNADRDFFVGREVAQKILDACPDAEWRLLFALSRYGGLRCPSEHMALKWSGIDWAHGRMTVHSPKTERHEGHAERVIPIFPELRPCLEDAYELTPPGTSHVIHKHRRQSNANANLRTRLYKIIRRAKVEPWPKLFQNLRSTRETELNETFPMHAVCAWLGNSERVAVKHYLQVTDEHFDRAADAGALHMRCTHLQNYTSTDSQVFENAEENLVGASQCDQSVGPEGFEPPTKGL